MADEETNEGNNLPNETDTNLQEEIDSSEPDLEVPDEKNEARQLNMGNIFMVFIIVIVLIFTVIMLFTKPKKSKQKKDDSIEKVSSKLIPKFPSVDSKQDSYSDSYYVESEEKQKEVDEIIASLPSDFQRQSEQYESSPAPVVSSKTSSVSTRPDTRNSKSPRKIDGLAGQSYSSQVSNNQNIVSAMMSGGEYGQYQGGNGNTLSKEEYISQLLSRSGNSTGYAGSNMTKSQQYQTDKEAFFNSGTGGNAGSGQYLSYASLWEGTIISGALETAINTDNPGIVIARVTENVYSSYDGSLLLIPEGSMLYATYNSSVSYGQDRVQIAWNLLIRPDGYRVQLGNMNGVDPQGASGAPGHVSNHPFETMKALGLVAVFSIIHTEMSEQIKTNNNQYVQNAMADTYSEAAKIGNKILDKALDIKPTITIKQGTEIKLITNLTLDLPPVKKFPVTRKYVRTQ